MGFWSEEFWARALKPQTLLAASAVGRLLQPLGLRLDIGSNKVRPVRESREVRFRVWKLRLWSSISAVPS